MNAFFSGYVVINISLRTYNMSDCRVINVWISQSVFKIFVRCLVGYQPCAYETCDRFTHFGAGIDCDKKYI